MRPRYYLPLAICYYFHRRENWKDVTSDKYPIKLHDIVSSLLITEIKPEEELSKFIQSIDDPHIVDEMEARTELDHGQCRALLAALTREFAFIQGPPGTGKSYLGIQLMKVLMDCKKTENLGPVVVV